MDLPNERKLERDIIATLAATPGWWEYIRGITVEHFSDIEARAAYNKMSLLKTQGREWLTEHDAVRWIVMGRQLSSSFELEEAAKRLQDVYICRAAVISAQKIAKEAYGGNTSEVERLVSELSLPSRGGAGKGADELAAELIADWGSLDKRTVKTHWSLLDNKNILKRREGFGLAARPSMGKSQLALQIAWNVVSGGGTVYVWSGEMDRYNCVGRIAGSMAGASRWDIEGSEMDELEYQKKLARIAEVPGLIIEDKPLTSLGVWSSARKIKKDRGLDLIIVDHIRLLTDKHDAERHRLGNIVRNLRDAAKELDCVSMMLIQLNRASEGRQNRRPTLGDLRDSGEIEENLDVAAFLYRDAYYKARDEGKQDQSGVVDFYCLKNRNGKLWGGKPLYFHEQGPRFTQVEQRELSYPYDA